MHPCFRILLFVGLAGGLMEAARGQGVRFYEHNGITYRETVRTVERPVIRTEWRRREQTVYEPQLQTTYRDSLRTYWTPVTQYEWVTRMHGRFNPFVTPYFTHEWAPVTRWERRAEVVQVPRVETKWVARKQTVSVPVPVQQMEERRVVTRQPVGGPRQAASRAHTPQRRIAARGRAAGEAFGVALDGDPPRQGLSWRPPDTSWQ